MNLQLQPKFSGTFKIPYNPAKEYAANRLLATAMILETPYGISHDDVLHIMPSPGELDGDGYYRHLMEMYELSEPEDYTYTEAIEPPTFDFSMRAMREIFEKQMAGLQIKIIKD